VSDDDPTLKPRPLNTDGVPKPDTTRRSKESEDEDEPEPWNAVCIVGLRVYSKDAELQVKLFEDGVGDMSDDEGTDADIENAEDVGEDFKTEEAVKTAKMIDTSTTGQLPLPIRAKDNAAPVDSEKMPSALAMEASSASMDGGASI
jgi:hypothetical protein